MANDAQATFAVNLEDNTSGPALDAAGALKKLRGSIDSDTKALREMQKAMKNLQGGHVVDVKQYRELKAGIDAKKQSIASAQSSYLALGGSMNKVPAKRLTTLFEELTKSAQGMPGPVSGAAGSLSKLRSLVAGGALALGIVAISVAMLAVVAASTAAVVALTRYGIAQADARRSELLQLEGLTKIRSFYGLAAGNAGEMQTAIDRVSASSALGRDKIAEYSNQLYKMGLRGDNLSAALEGVAIKASVQGEAQARMFAGWAAGAALTGKSVRALADDVKARLGGIAARQMLALDVQSKKMRESFDALFNGLKLEGFLTGLNSITSLFSQATESGKALRAIAQAALQPVIDALEFLAPVGKRFFQGMIIGVLTLGIMFLELRNYMRDTFAGSSILSQLNLMEVALWSGVFVVGAFAGVLGVTAVALGLVAAAVLAPIAAVAALGYAIGTAAGFLATLDWAALGASICDGIVSGVKRGAAAVMDAVKSLGKGAFDAFKDALGIASPSKAFAKLGIALPQGLEVGVNRGAPAANQAVQRMVTLPEFDAEQSMPAPSGGGPAQSAPSQPSVSIGEVHIHTTGETPREYVLDLKRELENILTGVAVRMGAPV